jgi:CRP-like cAMP-binding protein
VILYELSKDALLPLLQARPGMAYKLSEQLASRQLTRKTALAGAHASHRTETGIAQRVLMDIKRLFGLT